GGSTSYGGTVFKVNTDGTGYTELYNFTGGSDGAYPYAGVTLSSNVLYGTAHDRGGWGSGGVFRLNTDGAGFTGLKSCSALVNYTNSDGAYPYAGVTVSGSVLYGTTSSGGTSGAGTVFKLNTDGTGYTVLYSFTGGSDGGDPFAGVTLSGSVLYGITADFGSPGPGVIFRLKTNGTG